jgi:small subunit ribosomal protein S20
MAGGAPTKVKKKKKSVLKRNRQTIARTEVNRANRTQVRSAIRKLRAAISAGDAPAVAGLLGPTFSSIDRAIRKGVLKENTANRYKSRLARACNALAAGNE